MKPAGQAAPSVERITRLEDLERLREDWDRLLERCPESNLYLTHEWVSALWKANREVGTWTVLVFRSGSPGGEATAIIPLLRRRVRVRSINLWQVDLVTNLYGNHNQLLAAGDRSGQVARLLESLHEVLPGWDVFLIGSVAEPSDLAAILSSSRHAAGYHLFVESHVRSPYLELSGSWDEYLAAQSSNFRSDLRRKENKMAKAGGAAFETYRERQDVPTALGLIYEIEGQSWKEEAGSSITAVGRQRTFYESFLPEAGDRGWLRVTVLRVGDVPVAYDLGIVYGGRYSMLKTSYQQKYQDLSPGVVLRARVIRDLYAMKILEHDFLGRDEPWKLRWTEAVRPHGNYYLYNRRRVAPTLVYWLRRGRERLRS